MRWWLIGASLLVGSALAQEGGKPLTDSERAKRDAEKVFSFIKFKTVKKAPAAPAVSVTPPAPAPTRPAPAPSKTESAKAEPVRVDPAPPAPRVLDAALPQPAAAVEALPALTPLSAAAPASAVAPNVLPTPPVEDDEGDEADLKLIEFVAPELPPAVQATLGTSNPRVKLRFQVGANGRVLSVRAAEGVARRVAQVAERAVAQWRFEPIPAAREVEVEIAFRRE